MDACGCWPKANLTVAWGTAQEEEMDACGCSPKANLAVAWGTAPGRKWTHVELLAAGQPHRSLGHRPRKEMDACGCWPKANLTVAWGTAPGAPSQMNEL